MIPLVDPLFDDVALLLDRSWAREEDVSSQTNDKMDLVNKKITKHVGMKILKIYRKIIIKNTQSVFKKSSKELVHRNKNRLLIF